MKRFFLFLNAVLLAATCTLAWDGSVADSYAGGDGTAGNPYQIATAEQLALLAKEVNDDNNTHQNEYFILTADIDLFGMNGEDTIQWVPIGIVAENVIQKGDDAHTGHRYFRGNFDGQNHTIKNLYINNPTLQSGGGVFAHVNSCRLENINIENAYVYVGRLASALCARAAYNTFIDNCHILSGKVIVEDKTAGGIVAEIKSYQEIRWSSYNYDSYYYFYNGSVINCTNHATITISGANNYAWNGSSAVIGGIAGNVIGASGQGFFGSTNVSIAEAKKYTMKINKCVNYGDVIGVTITGGVCGFLSDGGGSSYSSANDTIVMDSCVNYGNIYKANSAYTGTIGGVVGQFMAAGIMQHCMNAGDISKARYFDISDNIPIERIGGIAGVQSTRISTIQYCINIGNCDSANYVGGICGFNYGEVRYCLNAGNIHTASYRAGGIAGYQNSSSINSCITTYFNYLPYGVGMPNASIVQAWYSAGAPPNNRRYEYYVSNCFYDWQWSPYGRGDSRTESTWDYGQRFTYQMLGDSLKGELSEEHWVFQDGLYPRPKGTENSDIALLAATPLHIKANSMEDYEYMYTINCGLQLGTAVSDIEWTTDSPLLIDGNNVTIVDTVPSGEMYRLYAHYGNATRVYEFQAKSIGTVDTIKVTTDKPYTFDGKTLNKSGEYIASYSSAGGCDSVVVLQLTMQIKPQVTIDTDLEVCQSETELLIPFRVNDGAVNKAVVNFSKTTEKQGFTSGEYEVTEDNIVLPLPAMPDAGRYACSIVLSDTLSGLSADEQTVEFDVLLDGFLHEKWGTVLLVDNNPQNGKPTGHDMSFTAFQWYKNGKAIADATEPFIYEKKGLNGTYSVSLTTAAGETLRTCMVEISRTRKEPHLIANILHGGEQLQIEALEGEITYTVVSLQGMVISAGILTATNPLQIKAPYESGYYLLVLTDAAGQKSVDKFIVK